MANYYASARSNYFKVKDFEKFSNFCAEVGLGIWKRGEGKESYAIYPLNEDSGGFDLELSCLDNDINEENTRDHGDLIEELSFHLEDDEVCILQEVGAEKLRYLNAYAICFNNKGERETLDLSSLAFEAAVDLTGKPENLTPVEY